MKSIVLVALLGTAVLLPGQPLSANPPVSIPKNPSDHVVVIGETRSHRPIPYVADLTIWRVLAASGGLAEIGLTRIHVIRNGAVMHSTSSDRILKDSKTDHFTLLPWDMVCVGALPGH